MMGNDMYVEIKVKGHLTQDWSDWLGDLKVANQANGEAVLRGQLPDQPALLGLLNRIHGLNLQLLSLSQSDNPPTETSEPGVLS
jgi:hypothetical protein